MLSSLSLLVVALTGADAFVAAASTAHRTAPRMVQMKQSSHGLPAGLTALAASAILTFSPTPAVLAVAPTSTGPTVLVADAQSDIAERKAKRKADEAAAAEAAAAKKAEAAAAKEAAKAAEPEKASVMNYSGETLSANEDFQQKFLFILAAVVL
eukprot:6029590-Prymnesium_polylepis.1